MPDLSRLSVSSPATQTPEAAVALQNHLRHTHVLRPGLHVHADDLVDAQDFTASGQIEQGLRIVVVLDGAVDVSYGSRRVSLGCAAGGRSGRVPQAMLISIAETDRFERRARRGAHARRLSVGVGADWLAQAMGPTHSELIDDFRVRHLALHPWQPSARIVAMAEQIVRAPDLNPLFLHLYMESRVLELVGEALGSLGHTTQTAVSALPPEAVRLLPHEHRRIRTLHDFLQREHACELSLDGLARQMGTNANTLQKHFRAVYGTTVFEFVREQRLQRARESLERDGITVGQAAQLAGYNSAANFATAYRKRFGLPPKHARMRV